MALLTLKIPNVPKVLSTVKYEGGMEIEIRLFKGQLGSYSFVFEEQKEGESDVDYVKRFLAENMKAHMRLKAQIEQIGAIRERANALPKIEAEVIDEGTIE